jgi:hypothetical protein
MSDDLVKRARAGFDGPPYPKNLLTELADEVEQLRAFYNEAVTTLERRNAEIERLKAEVKREQDRLAYINSTVWGVGPGPGWPT